LEERILYADGPLGPLEGVLTLPDTDALDDTTPVVMIVPGASRIDRDGNSPLGISGAPYRMLAFVLAAHGFPVFRADKRGMFGSRRAILTPYDVTVTDFVEDLVSWVKIINTALPMHGNGVRAIVLAGHSEGGVISLVAAPRLQGCTGLVLLACPGRPFGQVLRMQLESRLSDTTLLQEAFEIIAQLESGKRVDGNDISRKLRPLFTARQGYRIDLFSYDPAALIAAIEQPCLIAQGTEDLQVSVADAEALHMAQPNAQLTLIEDMNHILKIVPPGDRAANFESYENPDLPISEALTKACIGFISNVYSKACERSFTKLE